jgi:hypothetical protein
MEKNMQLNVGKEIAAMEQMAVGQLRDRYLFFNFKRRGDQ